MIKKRELHVLLTILISNDKKCEPFDKDHPHNPMLGIQV